MPNLMTQAEYARHRGVTRPAVSNWKNKGLLVLAEDPADGRIKVDVVRTDARINGQVDPGRGRPPVGEAPALPFIPAPAPLAAMPLSAEGSLAVERLEHVREQRIGQALKNANAAGELVPLIEAERRISEVGRVARERVHSWFRGVAERIAAERDIRAIMVIGEEGIDGVFAELADAARRGDFAGDDDEELSADEIAELEAAGNQVD